MFDLENDDEGVGPGAEAFLQPNPNGGSGQPGGGQPMATPGPSSGGPMAPPTNNEPPPQQQQSKSGIVVPPDDPMLPLMNIGQGTSEEEDKHQAMMAFLGGR